MSDHCSTTVGTDVSQRQSSEECKLPEFSEAEVREIISTHYGRNTAFKRLNGERDLNYLIDDVGTGEGKCVFKICNQRESKSFLMFQSAVMKELKSRSRFQSIQSVESHNGNLIEQVVSKGGAKHYCRMTTYLEGDLFSSVVPRSPELLHSLGEALADFGSSVSGLQANALERPLAWHMQKALKITSEFETLVNQKDKQKLVVTARQLFSQNVLATQNELPKGIIHNDANDNNIVVDNLEPWRQEVKCLIDYGDMVFCWRVTDLAVACAYAMLGEARPLDVAAHIVRGYHQITPLNEAEISALFSMIMMRLAMSVCNSARQIQIEPDNPYLAISEKPAWDLLGRLVQVSPDYAHFLFRDACGFSAIPHENQIRSWIQQQEKPFPICDMPGSTKQMLLLDTSISSPFLDNQGTEEYDVERMQRSLDRALEDAGATTGIGRYNEYRLIYQSDDFSDVTGHRRTLHLGIDIFQPAGSLVFCPLDGIVHSVADNRSSFDYGGTVILRHDIPVETDETISFYTLYGHLSFESISRREVGTKLIAGETIGRMGRPDENGNWPPHVHFQIMSNMLDETETFVGVGSHAHRQLWLALCPDPNLILRLPDEWINQPLSDAVSAPEQIYQRRAKSIPKTLSVSYREPLSIARGAAQYLYDFTGKSYLDAVNNVPHVGHCHPHVVEAARQSSGVLNTNTRYLYQGLADYAERLLEKCPGTLSKVFLVNSGSEANDLALRMAFCYTNRSDVIALEHGYHGNLGALIDISGYKHDGPGGNGPPDWVHKAPVPDLYRSALHRDADGGEYAESIKELLDKGKLRDQVAAFISEAIPGCGGQLMLPVGYLKAVYDLVHGAGGICIADEVQTGFGRVGSHFWAFELQDVVPDIVTFGKPAGNGHPIGGVITTDVIADSFTNGMEYFNTFGGNPVSCSIGTAVLDVLEREKLQSNAFEVGNYLMKGLKKLSARYPVMGDVRGSGLFIGVELVEDQHRLQPAASQASYVAERMKQEGVLISTDGPWHNVLKIKPPIVFNIQNCDFLISKLDKVMSERWAQPV